MAHGSIPHVPLKKKTVFFQSLGCAKNLVDTEVMVGISLGDGFSVVPRPEEASVIVVNTCSFIEASKHQFQRCVPYQSSTSFFT